MTVAALVVPLLASLGAKLVGHLFESAVAPDTPARTAPGARTTASAATGEGAFAQVLEGRRAARAVAARLAGEQHEAP
jgi:hypothetical protein